MRLAHGRVPTGPTELATQMTSNNEQPLSPACACSGARRSAGGVYTTGRQRPGQSGSSVPLPQYRSPFAHGHQMKRRVVLTSFAGAFAAWSLPTSAQPALPPVQVFKNANCGCCAAWVAHMKGAGFGVTVTEVDDTSVARKKYGLPDRFGSCHTAVVAGYVVEGHVPATDVKKLLAMKPVATGVAVPGMPVGSPGMEVGSRKDPYQVLLIDKQGRARVFSDYSQARSSS